MIIPKFLRKPDEIPSLMFHVLLIIVLFSFSSLHAEAAPFCVETHGMSAECHYYDANQCRRRATELSGLCTANKKEVRFPSGSGSYCLVISGNVIQCLYGDSSTCNREAQKNNAICIRNPRRRSPADPFRFDIEIFY